MSGTFICEDNKSYLCVRKPECKNPDLPVTRKITKLPKKQEVRVRLVRDLTPRHEPFSRGNRGS